MYGWIWRHLPGNVVAKLFGVLVLLVGVLALLYFAVFPWLEPRLPFGDVTVGASARVSTTAGPAVIGPAVIGPGGGTR